MVDCIRTIIIILLLKLNIQIFLITHMTSMFNFYIVF